MNLFFFNISGALSELPSRTLLKFHPNGFDNRRNSQGISGSK